MRVKHVAVAAALAVVAVPSLASAERTKTINACKLVTKTQVEKVLGHPVDIRRGATAASCAFRGGDWVPVVGLTSNGGTTAYRRIVRAIGSRTTRLRLGTQAVTYDAQFGDPVLHTRGVVVRKGSAVLHLSAGGVGDNPAGLPTVAMLIRLARYATARL